MKLSEINISIHELENLMNEMIDGTMHKHESHPYWHPMKHQHRTNTRTGIGCKINQHGIKSPQYRRE